MGDQVVERVTKRSTTVFRGSYMGSEFLGEDQHGCVEPIYFVDYASFKRHLLAKRLTLILPHLTLPLLTIPYVSIPYHALHNLIIPHLI